MINNIEIYSNKNALEDITDYDDSFSVDSIKQYLKEIGEYPLLNKEAEAELFARLENGESELFNYIVNCNLRLVVSVARRFTYHGLDILDLIQEGNMGLMTAVEKFDYKLGYKFSTYATYWIERSIKRGLAFKSRNVRIPLLKHNLLLRIVAIQKALINKLGREPKIEEIAEEMDLPVSKINELINLNTPVSLNSVVDADSKKSAELGDFVASDIDLEDDYINESLQDEIQKLLLVCNLNKREIDIITSRFGLFGNKKLTLEELGSKYNLTRERIRQIEKKVIIKFIKNQETDKLAVYTDNPEKAEENLREKRNAYWHKNIDTSVVRSVKYNKRTNNCEEIEGDNFMKKRTKNTIYDYFEGYSKESVDKVIELLPPEEKYILKLWENEPIGQSIYPFFNNTLAKIRRKLKNPYLILTVSKTPGIGRLRVRDLMEQDKNRMLEESIKEEMPTEDTQVVEKSKKDNVNMLNNLRSFSFTQMLEVMSVKEAVIVALRFGYIDGKCFKTEKIADFLGITTDEVRETSRKILLLYKEQINSLLDNIINDYDKSHKTR